VGNQSSFVRFFLQL